MEDERELVRRLRNNDEDAFSLFSAKYASIAAYYFGSRGLPRDEALDVAASWVHDTLLKIDKYEEREGASFAAWLFRLMSNAASDWWRSRKHIDLQPLSERLALTTEDELGPVGVSLDEAIAVHEALLHLNERERHIVDLRLSGCSFAEAGLAAGISEGNARVTYHRALTKLQALLETDPRIASRKISA